MLLTLAKRWSTKVMLTGAGGQVGAELLKAAQVKYGEKNVLATDLREPSSLWNPDTCFKPLDVTNPEEVEKVFSAFKPKLVYHLASTLSAPSELNPKLAVQVNILGLHNVLEQAKNLGAQIFACSSIASFGETTPKIPGDMDLQRPSSIYGVTKVHLELMGSYYNTKYGLDFRCLRVPIVTSEAHPGGGAAAFTVTIFYDLLKHGKAIIPLSPETKMPLMYLPDLTRSIIELMEADNSKLKFRSYTMASASVSVGEYVAEVNKYIQGEVIYKPDFRDALVKSWPDGTDPNCAYRDWGHKIHYDIPKMVKSIYQNISRDFSK